MSPDTAAQVMGGDAARDSGRRPNIVFILSDDHAAHAISAYGSSVNQTPHIDRIARDGVRVERCYVTNSLCTPSRASILTGTYSHVNGVYTLSTPIDAAQPTFITALRDAGYRTALFGKWHMGHGDGHDPVGFDRWEVLIDQGEYHDPQLLTADGLTVHDGYATDIITDHALEWLDEVVGSDAERPWCVLVWHKAPHRPWIPDDAHDGMYSGTTLPLPKTFDDDLSGRAAVVQQARMKVTDMTLTDLKVEPPSELSDDERKRWIQQRWMEDYLACIASIDDNVGRLHDWLDAHGQRDRTLVVYSSDQGFFLGDHGMFDKRLMYEQSLKMPLLVSLPGVIPAGGVHRGLVSNVDLAQTLLACAGVPAVERMQGRSFWTQLTSAAPVTETGQIYYRYWENDDNSHDAPAHYGLVTERYKLIHYYNAGLGLPGCGPREWPAEWELFDTVADPDELHNVYADAEYAAVVSELTQRLAAEQARLGDRPHPG